MCVDKVYDSGRFELSSDNSGDWIVRRDTLQKKLLKVIRIGS